MVGSAGTAPKDALKACRRSFAYLGIFSMFVSVLMLALPLYMLQIFDRVLASQSLETLLYLTIMVVGAVLALGLLELVRSRILVQVSDWLEKKLAPEAFAKSVAAALHSRPYRTEALRDLQQLRAFLGGAAVISLFDAPWVPLYLLVVYLLHPVLGLVALTGAILLFAFALLNDLATRKPLRDASRLAFGSMQRAEAATRCAEAVEAMGMLPGITARWMSENGRALKGQLAASNRAGAILAGAKVLRFAVQIAVLAAGAYLVVQQELTAGAMIASSILMSRALAPVEQSIGTWRQLVAARAAYARLQKLFDELSGGVPAMRLPVPQGHLRAERVTFAYPDTNRLALNGVSFEILPGEVLAVVGPSAAGKSTLARLLLGLWPPAAGKVRLDGADLSAWDREDLGRHVGYLPQDVELFAGTVAEQIARHTAAEPEAIVEAAQRSGAHAMILRLPQGYGTRIVDGGANLSAGQRQRIALARALFGRPRLLVLDEPDSNLDSEGEQDLSRAIAASKEDGACVVVIAHRRYALLHADKVLVLRNGVVDVFGARDEVLTELARRRATATEPALQTARAPEQLEAQAQP